MQPWSHEERHQSLFFEVKLRKLWFYALNNRHSYSFAVLAAEVKGGQAADRSRVRPSGGKAERIKLRSVSRFHKSTFLYCLSLPSCAAAAEESVAFNGGSPEVSTRGDTTQDEVKYENESLDYWMLNINKLREILMPIVKEARLSFEACLWWKIKTTVIKFQMLGKSCTDKHI